MRIGILIPHIFAQERLRNRIIFAPLELAIQLADGLSDAKHEVTLYTPGPIKTKANSISVDLSFLQEELINEECTLPEFAVKNPLAFTSVSRQVHAELTRRAFEDAGSDKLDVLLVYMCEDEIPLYFSNLVNIPIFFTHHDPFNFYRKYRVRFPRLVNLNYISISYSQRTTAHPETNFVANIYNGIDLEKYYFNGNPDRYFASLGRIVQNKGVHTAVKVCRETNSMLKVAGKHYSSGNDKESTYWDNHIRPFIDNKNIQYLGFLRPPEETGQFLRNAKALLFPISWEEPFGLVMIESLACGTPVIAFNNGAVPEIIKHGKNGFIVNNEKEMISAMNKISEIDRKYCRDSVEEKFSIKKMVAEYENLFKSYLQE